MRLRSRATAQRLLLVLLRRARRVPRAGGAPGTAGSIGVSQYGQTCQIGSSGAPQLTHACLSFVVQTGQTR
jgi:hypothetical protein